jgi:hypothetical protein
MFFFSVLKLELSNTKSGEKEQNAYPEKPSVSLSVDVAWYQTRDEAHAKFKFYIGGFFGLIAERLAGVSDHSSAQTRGKGLGHGDPRSQFSQS